MQSKIVMLVWLFIVSVGVVTAAAASFITRYRRWTGPYGLTLETKDSLKALGVSVFFILISMRPAIELFRIPERWASLYSVGMMLAASYSAALSILRARWRRVGALEVALWCRELGLLLRQNVPIIRALDILAQDCRSYRIYEFTLALREAVRSGEALSDWVCLPPLAGYAAEVIRAGERSGDLASALIGLADVFERRHALRMGERRPARPERPRAEPTEEEFIYTFLNFPEGAREAEKLLSTRVAGTEVSEVLANDSPAVRVVNIMLAHAIREGAEHVFLVGNGGLSVEYGDDENRRVVMTLPPHIKDPVLRRLKLMADIAYWRKPPATGFINVTYDNEPYRLILWVEQAEDEWELLRIDVLPASRPAEPGS